MQFLYTFFNTQNAIPSHPPMRRNMQVYQKAIFSGVETWRAASQ